MKKRINELTDKELKSHIFAWLDEFELYSKSFRSMELYTSGIKNIQIIRDKIKNNDIKKREDITDNIIKITDFLMEPYPVFLKNKMNQYLYILDKVYQNKSLDLELYSEKISRIDNIRKSNNEIRFKHLENYSDVEAALSLNSRETEDMQHVFLKLIPSDSKYYDEIIDILSINRKVRKGNSYKTDITAIKDCQSHGHYKIDTINKSITFENHNDKYDFYQKFTFREFERFMGLKGQLYALFFNLIHMIYFTDILEEYINKVNLNNL